jgi:hypothetical protein
MHLPLGLKLPDSVTEDYGQFFLRSMVSKDDQAGAVTVPNGGLTKRDLLHDPKGHGLMVNGINRLGHQIKQQIGPAMYGRQFAGPSRRLARLNL